MAIERKNSFHLLLSDDELELLRLLAERDGLNPSDYLRTTLRRLAGPPAHLSAILHLGELLTEKPDIFESALGVREPGEEEAREVTSHP